MATESSRIDWDYYFFSLMIIHVFCEMLVTRRVGFLIRSWFPLMYSIKTKLIPTRAYQQISLWKRAYPVGFLVAQNHAPSPSLTKRKLRKGNRNGGRKKEVNEAKRNKNDNLLKNKLRTPFVHILEMLKYAFSTIFRNVEFCVLFGGWQKLGHLPVSILWS